MIQARTSNLLVLTEVVEECGDTTDEIPTFLVMYWDIGLVEKKY